MELGENRFLVVGLGVTGVETSRFLRGAGAQVKATDSRDTADLGEAAAELAAGGWKCAAELTHGSCSNGPTRSCSAPG